VRRVGELAFEGAGEREKGLHRFNRKVWKIREAKPEAEQVAVAVDPIIAAATFDSVQAMLKAKNPRAMPRSVQ
jgi:site-specific DNA recombinase